jgi:hypothetical protein
MLAVASEVCDHCGQEIPDRKPVRFGPWLYHIDPLRRITFNGLPVDLTPQQTIILGELINRHKVSRLGLAMVALGDDANFKCIDVQLVRVRKALPRGWEIINHFGWGYELCETSRAQELANGSRCRRSAANVAPITNAS